MYEILFAITVFVPVEIPEAPEIDTQGKDCQVEDLGEDLYLVNCVPSDLLV